LHYQQALSLPDVVGTLRLERRSSYLAGIHVAEETNHGSTGMVTLGAGKNSRGEELPSIAFFLLRSSSANLEPSLILALQEGWSWIAPSSPGSPFVTI
jgi:hypothetical protein